VIELEKKMGSSLLFSGTNKQFAANCKKSRMYILPNSKRQEKKECGFGFLQSGFGELLSNFFEQSKICTPHTHPKQSSSSWMWSFYSLQTLSLL
jgi:hypothetical protein